MTDKLREAAQKALEALEWAVEQGGGPACEHESGGAVCFCVENKAITALRAALAQQDASFKPITRAFKSDIDRLKTYNSVDIYTLPVGATGDVTLYIKE